MRVSVPTSVEMYVRGALSAFNDKMTSLGYTFGSNTFAFKDGDTANTRADVLSISDLHVVSGTLDGPHQLVRFTGPNAARDAAIVEMSWYRKSATAAPQDANDTGLTIHEAPIPATDATNLVSNSVMTGAADDSPGPQAFPTDWSVIGSSTITPAIKAVDTTSGAETITLEMIDSGSGSAKIWFTASTADIPAVVGEVLFLESDLRLSAGSLTNVSEIHHALHQYRSDGTTATDFSFLTGDDFLSGLDGTMRTFDWSPRISTDQNTSGNAPPNDIAFVRYSIYFVWTGAVNFTVELRRPRASNVVSAIYDRRPVFFGHNARSETRASLPDITTLSLKGFNLAGAEFGSVRPGTHGIDYVYPWSGAAGSKYRFGEDMIKRGFNCFRIPFKGQRLQRSRLGAFDAGEQARLIACVEHYTNLGAYVVLDPHDFGAFAGAVINRVDATGTVISSTDTTVVLSGASEITGWLAGLTIVIDGQSRTISDYTVVPDPITKTATVSAWDANPVAGEAWEVVGGGATIADFEDFWNKLATLFKDNPRVIFGLMNEPTSSVTIDEWFPAQQAAINEIRNVVGANNLILATGVDFAGAHSWITSGNGAAALTTTDPGDNLVWEAHQYFDLDSSGTSTVSVSSDEVIGRILVFTNWLRANGLKGFIGEFGGEGNEDTKLVMRDFLAHMQDSADVYVGWVVWSGGPWWATTYVNRVETVDYGGREEFHPFAAVS